MRSRPWLLRLAIVAALAGVGCSNSDSVTTSEVTFVESYVVGEDRTTLEVQVTVACTGTRIRVFAVETADAVKLFAVRNDPDCRGTEVGYLSSSVVRLEAALGDRAVIDAGCEFVFETSPCTPPRSNAPSGT